MISSAWKTIAVAIVDPFGREQLALDKAAAIAARCKAGLILLNSFMLPQPTPDTVLGLSQQNLKLALRDRKRKLEQLAAKLRGRGIKTRCMVEWDFPIQDAIVRMVIKSKPDLLIAESHRHSRLARWVLANTDWELIRNCPCPLWFVRSSALPNSIKTLVAIDPRHAHDKPARLDDRLLRAANALTHQLGGAVSIAHAYHAPVSASPGTFIEPIRIPVSSKKAQAFVAATHKAVDRLAVRHGVAAEDRYIQDGDATAVLTGLTKRLKINLLVLGAVSRRMLQRPFIGNTAEKVIDAVDCDVFVLKPAGFKTLVARAGPKI